MGFLDFLIGLVKNLAAIVVGGGLLMTGSYAVSLGQSIVGGVMLILGFVSIAFFVYNRRQMSKKY